MMVLAIDTCGSTGSIALGRVEGDTVSILAQAELARKTYSAQLVPALRDLLNAQKEEISALDTIVVVNGPGSFTGVRIGVSSAKGFAEALAIPVLAISRLAVLAWKAGSESAAIDAGRGEFYIRVGLREFLFTGKSASFTDFSPDSDALAVCEEDAVRIFPGAIMVDPPTAADALRFAAPLLTAADFADVSTLDANYLRRSDAEIFAKTSTKTSTTSGKA